LLAVAFGIAVQSRLNGGVDLSGATEPVEKDGSVLFAITLPDTAGAQQALSQWRGKVVVVNFWATWCVPCREEMPQFVQLQDEFRATGLQFVGIAVDQADKVDRFSAEIGLNYPALIGGYGALELARSLGDHLGVLPFTIILDRTGRIVYSQVGPLAATKLRSIVAQLF